MSTKTIKIAESANKSPIIFETEKDGCFKLSNIKKFYRNAIGLQFFREENNFVQK